MRVIAYSYHNSKDKQAWLVKGQHTWARIDIHVKQVVDRLEQAYRRLLGITTDNAFPKLLH